MCVLFQKAKEVFGIDVVESSINDAKVNAEKNKVVSCEFTAGRAEELLPGVLKKATGKKIVAVVDPPRDGLGKNQIKRILLFLLGLYY